MKVQQIQNQQTKNQQIQKQPVFGISGTYSLKGAKKPMKFSKSDIDYVLDGITCSINGLRKEGNYMNAKITDADLMPGYQIIRKIVKGAKSILYGVDMEGKNTAIISKFEVEPFSLLRTKPKNIEPLKDNQFIVRPLSEGNSEYDKAVTAIMSVK